jgi:hypothetical protein
MSLLEGGNFKCPTGFEAATKQEWNDHNKECDLHTMGGVTRCIECDDVIEFKGLPYQPFKVDGSLGIALKCEECQNKTIGHVKVTKLDIPQ